MRDCLDNRGKSLLIVDALFLSIAMDHPPSLPLNGAIFLLLDTEDLFPSKRLLG